MLRKLFFLLAVLLLPIGFAAAQESGGFTIFSFDIGTNPAYNLDDSAGTAYVTATSFALNLRVADSLIVGFTTFDTANPVTLLNLKYEILKSVRAGISIGLASFTSPSPAPAILGWYDK